MEYFDKLKNNFSEDWLERLKPYLFSEEFKNILSTLSSEKKNYNIYPEANNVFRVFKETPLSKVRVVILGQDPYYTKGVADGLAFSSNIPTYIPPSLNTIYQELENEYSSGENKLILKRSSSLKSWANQGVLLLNTALTVREKEPGVHIKLWRPFITEVFKALAEECKKSDNFIIFLLWGNYAKSFQKELEEMSNRFQCLTAGHPSPLSKKLFLGCGHFDRTNKLLSYFNMDNQEIKWYEN